MLTLNRDSSNAINSVSLHLPDEAWHDDESGGLIVTVIIGGAGHHLHARKAWTGPNGDFVQFRDPDDEEAYMEGLQLIHEGGYELATIKGDEYIVFMTPFSR